MGQRENAKRNTNWSLVEMHLFLDLTLVRDIFIQCSWAKMTKYAFVFIAQTC